MMMLKGGVFLKLIPILSFLIVLVLSHRAFPSNLPVYALTVRIFPEEHSIEGKGRIVIPAGVKTKIVPGKTVIKSFDINGKKFSVPGRDSAIEVDAAAGSTAAEVEYRAFFSPPPLAEDTDNGGAPVANVIDPSGVVLLSGWYPEVAVPCSYELTVELPLDFEAISEADSATISWGKTIKTVRFIFPHPVSGITLVAGRYRVREEAFHGISLKTYFFPESEALTADYIRYAKEYLTLYESLIGAFPYKSFSMVENTLQTGYSFPTYTLLGSQVIRLPFIVKTSLGHEVLHQWFGHYVGVDYEKGNWSEGLTTYLADHWYEAVEGRGAEYRKKIMIDYLNYVSPENEMSLRDFKNREDFSTKAIGYGKGAMVFHMLRKTMGDNAFFEVLRKLIADYKDQKISWDQIKLSFTAANAENAIGEDFFPQWVERKETPYLRVSDPLVVFRDGHYLLVCDIIQEGTPFTIRLPVRVVTSEGEDRFLIKVDKQSVHWEEKFPQRPLGLFIDEEYDVMRRLSDTELPPVLSGFTGRKESMVVLPEGDKELYDEVAGFFKKRGYSVRDKVSNNEIRKHSMLLLSPRSKLYRRLFADSSLSDEGFIVKVYKNPLNPERVVVVFNAKNGEELKIAFKKIFRYGNYSFLQFKNGNNISRETDKAANGIILDLRVAAEAIATTTTLGLDEVIEKIKLHPIIFIGEVHDEYAHHVMQYEIIRRLYGKGKKPVIGMEMFQRPFQNYIDQYIYGEMSEEEFLKKTEYFKRWGFDYNLYRDILQFARVKQLPVIALNVRKEIIEKVAKEGIDSLSAEEDAEVPQDMDMTNQEYKAFMRAAFSHHSGDAKKDFENFFQSQIIWDETMAHSIAAVVRDYPGSQVVALVGNGHLLYSWGIPDRVRRLTGERGTVILNHGEEGVSRGLADFILFPEYVDAPKSPKLMVSLEDTDEGVTVKGILKGPAEQAGMKEGDVIKKIEEREIEDVADIKIILLNKRKGDHVKVMIRRKELIPPGEKEIVLQIGF